MLSATWMSESRSSLLGVQGRVRNRCLKVCLTAGPSRSNLVPLPMLAIVSSENEMV